MSEKKRVSFLTVSEFFRLDAACASIASAWDEPYLVGSVLTRPDYRDVDLRLMLPDDQFAAMFQNKYALLLMNTTVSDWLKAMTSLPIDFQFQDHTKANVEHQGMRNPMGQRGRLWSGENLDGKCKHDFGNAVDALAVWTEWADKREKETTYRRDDDRRDEFLFASGYKAAVRDGRCKRCGWTEQQLDRTTEPTNGR